MTSSTHGRKLTDYPRPSVTVDVAVLTVKASALQVVAVQSPRGLALPGTFLHPGERLSDAADRALSTKAGLDGLEFHQIGMFDDPARDDRGWVLSMAHTAVIPVEKLSDAVVLVEIDGNQPKQELAFDHAAMSQLAVEDLRRRYGRTIDPAGIAGSTFTLLDLRRLYEVVFDKELPKDTFRRQVAGALTGTGKTSTSGGGRPAELYRRTDEAVLPESAAAFFRG